MGFPLCNETTSEMKVSCSRTQRQHHAAIEMIGVISPHFQGYNKKISLLKTNCEFTTPGFSTDQVHNVMSKKLIPWFTQDSPRSTKFLPEFIFADGLYFVFCGTNFCHWENFFLLGINLCDFQDVAYE